MPSKHTTGTQTEQGPTLGGPLVGVHRCSRAVSREMIDVIAVAIRQARVGARVWRHPYSCTHHTVAVLVVVGVQPVGGESGHPGGVTDDLGPARDIDCALRGAIGPTAEICSEPCRALSRAREYLDDAGHGVGPIQDTHGSPDDFDA